MALRFDLNKYNKIKEAYIDFLRGGHPNYNDLSLISTYKAYLDIDSDVANVKISLT